MKYQDQFAQELKANAGGCTDTVERLVAHLDEVRSIHQAEWPAMARAWREHELHALLLEDPYTRRAFTKPRGYAGDATTLDFVYGHAEVRDAVGGCSEIGRMIYSYTGGASLAANAVRWRCSEIARRIEAAAATHGTARVLAFACGRP